MAAAASDYFKAAILNQWFRGVATAIPSDLHLALYTGDPAPDDSGPEVSGGAYARAAIPSALASWTAPAPNGTLYRIDNVAVLTFADPTADWGFVTHWGLKDAPAAGNLLIYGDLAVGRMVLAGDIAPAFPIGALDIDFG